MTEKRKSRAQAGAGRDPGEQDVYEALKSSGWMVPECEEDVRRAEAELSQALAPLPESLADPRAVFEGKAVPPGTAPGAATPGTPPRAATPGTAPGAACGLAALRLSVFLPDPQTEHDLARAARQGGPIPPEIEEKMRRDRKTAEDASQQDESEP